MTSTGASEQIFGEWVAVNRASGSVGSIHDDETARKLGFRGGFVPGATLVGYACEAWRRGEGLSLALHPFALSIDLRAPVYEGEVARVRAREDGQQWIWRVETESSGVTTEGTIDTSPGALPPDVPASTDAVFDGIDLGNIAPSRRTFSRSEVESFYRVVLATDPPAADVVPVSVGMWCNPMTPVIERLNATHTTVHRSSDLLVQRLPLAEISYRLVTTVAGVTPRGPGKGLVHVHCEVLDGDGSRLALIHHRSAVRRRN
jgi:hypothetical protein